MKASRHRLLHGRPRAHCARTCRRSSRIHTPSWIAVSSQEPTLIAVEGGRLLAGGGCRGLRRKRQRALAAASAEPASRLRRVSPVNVILPDRTMVVSYPAMTHRSVIAANACLTHIREAAIANSQLVVPPAALRIGSQRAISAFTKASNFAGCVHPWRGSSRRDRSGASAREGSSSDLSSASASRSTISFGTPFGAKMPAQMFIW